jgi:hypothetical protein
MSERIAYKVTYKQEGRWLNFTVGVAGCCRLVNITVPYKLSAFKIAVIVNLDKK